MFPNEVMTKPADLERHPRRDDRGPRRNGGSEPRLIELQIRREDTAHSAITGIPADQWQQSRSEYRPCRLRLHGPDALERVQTRQRFLRPRLSPGAQGRVRTHPPRRRRQFADELGLRIGRDRLAAAWSRSKDIDAIDICTPNNTHAEIAIAAAQAGKMVLCEKPLSMDLKEGAAMVEAVEKAGVPNTVWYNYRRVPAVTLAKKLIDQGKLGRIFHYRANFLQDWTISADLPQGGTGLWRLDAAAAGSGVTGDLLAHCIDTAIWLNGSINTVCRDDRDIRQGAQAHPHGQGRAGQDRRCLRVPLPVRERLARAFRIDPLRARPQGALHVRDQRREGLDQVGPARPAPAPILRPRRRGPAPRLAVDPRHRRRPPLHEALVGAGAADRL